MVDVGRTALLFNSPLSGTQAADFSTFRVAAHRDGASVLSLAFSSEAAMSP